MSVSVGSCLQEPLGERAVLKEQLSSSQGSTAAQLSSDWARLLCVTTLYHLEMVPPEFCLFYSWENLTEGYRSGFNPAGDFVYSLLLCSMACSRFFSVSGSSSSGQGGLPGRKAQSHPWGSSHCSSCDLCSHIFAMRIWQGNQLGPAKALKSQW